MMDKNQWISEKIKKLEQENKGRSHAQNVAIAFSMFENMKQDGGYQLPQYQDAGTFLEQAKKTPDYMRTIEQSNAISKASYFDNKAMAQTEARAYPGISPQNQGLLFPQPQSANDWAQSFSPVVPQVKVAAQKKQVTSSTPTTSTSPKPGEVTPVNTAAQQVAEQVAPTNAQTNYIPDFNYVQGDYNLSGDASTADNTDKFGNPTGATNKDFEYIQGDANLSGNVTEADKVDKFGNPLSTTTNAIQPNEKIQFFNPYAGVDIPTAASTLGQFTENGDALGIAGSGVKLATGLARNFFGGMGLQRRNNQVMDDYYERQRSDLTRPEVLQTGGVIEPPLIPLRSEVDEAKKMADMERYKLLRASAIRGSGVKSDYVPTPLNTEAEKLEAMEKYKDLRASALPGYKVDSGYTPNTRFPDQAFKDYKDYKLANTYQDGGDYENPFLNLTHINNSSPEMSLEEIEYENSLPRNNERIQLVNPVDIKREKEFLDYLSKVNNTESVLFNPIQKGEIVPEEQLQNKKSMYQFGGSFKPGNYSTGNYVVDAYTRPGSTSWNIKQGLRSMDEEDEGVSNIKPEIPVSYNDVPETWKLVDSFQKKDEILTPVSKFGQNNVPTPSVFPEQKKQIWETVPHYQDGGVQQQNQVQQIEQQIIESLQKGIDPQQIVQNLVQQGVPEEQVMQMVQQIVQQMQSQQQPQEQAYMQDGGKMNKALTGEYLFGMDKNNPIQQPNAEIENGEHVQHPTGEIQKAVGDTHENGGIDVKLEDNTRILSDHLKPKIDCVRKIKKEYSIDVKSSDTYSKILDKYSKKIGLSKVVDEQEELIAKMEKVVTTNKDEEALGLNTQYLSEKLKELEDKKKPLEEERKQLFSYLFKEQEDSKPKEEKSNYQNGGNFNEAILQLAQKYNIPQEEVNGMFKNGGIQLPKYQDGAKTIEERRKELESASYTDRTRKGDMYAEIKSRGYTGSNNIGEMQAWMNQNYPNEVVDYFTKNGQPMTAKHVDIVKDKFRNVFDIAGVSPKKDSAKYTAEEKEKLKTALGENATNEFWKEGFNDNKWDWRFPTIGYDIKAPAVGMQGQQPIAPGLPNFYQAPEVGQAPIDAEDMTEKAKRDANILLLPDQSPMLPGSLQAHLKINRRFDRLNPALVSPEQALEELNRQTVATKERLNIGAGAERITGELGLSANTQNNINKIVTDTEKLNSQIISNTDARNATIQAAEENAAAQDALSYEQRQLTAKAKTDADINNYYNTLRENNVRNYNKVNDLNLLNQMYNDFQFTGTGIEKTSPNIQFTLPNNSLPTPTTSTKKKKQNGGRFKK